MPSKCGREQRPAGLVGAGLGAAAFVVSLALDVQTTVRYHQALAASGGLADHSDASYHLAYHLQNNGLGAPIALDWGMDAPVRYLTRGTVTPIEIFGYASPAEVDAGFAERLAPFLDNPDNVYLLHAPGFEVFHGRRAAFLAEAARSRPDGAARGVVYAGGWHAALRDLASDPALIPDLRHPQ